MRRLCDWLCDARGGVATTFAIAAPVLAMLACGAIDLAAVASSKGQMQAAADAAALNAAHQLEISDAAGIQARADALVRGQLDGVTDFTYVVETEIGAGKSDITVRIEGSRPSFFANLLPPGGWSIAVEATAKPMARRPLCVLNTSPSQAQNLTLSSQAKLSAPECLISSNAGISVASGATLSAAAIQSSGPASGPINPSPMVGAPQIPDPFASMTIKPDNMPCQLGDTLAIIGLLGGTFYIPPGVHCGNIIIGKNQKVILQPGEHYFLKSKLMLKGNAELIGDNVTIVFDFKSSFQFAEESAIRLKGRKTGVFSGFVIATTRQNTNTFEISSDNARELLGTIYVPSSKLLVTGQNNDIADESAWTVILAKHIELTGSARLVVNASYEGSGVPVPKGVGPLSGVALTQ